DRLLAVVLLLGSGRVALAEPVEPLTLAEAVRRAIERSPTVRVARSAADSDVASTRIARAARSPELALSTTPGYANGLPPGQLPSVFGVQFRQALYDPDRRASGLDADAHAAISSAERSRAQTEVARRAATLFLRRMADDRLVAAADRREKALGRAA